MLNIVLFEPEIPPNTGNIIRLAANTGFQLHLIEPLGFSLDEKAVRRSGMDYQELAEVQVHASWEDYLSTAKPERVFAISTKGRGDVFTTEFKKGDSIVFGPETRGLSEEFRQALPSEQVLRIPMTENSRSLNLSNAVAIVVYEAWRQMGFQDAI